MSGNALVKTNNGQKIPLRPVIIGGKTSNNQKMRQIQPLYPKINIRIYYFLYKIIYTYFLNVVIHNYIFLQLSYKYSVSFI